MKHFDDQLEKALIQAKASIAVEGLNLTDEEEALVRVALKGELTHEEFLQLAKEQALKAD